MLFGDLFDDDQDYQDGTSTLLNNHQRLPRNCAFGLDLPDIERKAGCPIGLKNQGSTCYLNSLLQILFFTPEFRGIIYKVPLFKQTLDQPTNYLQQQSKTKFVLGFQKLFSEMQLLDTRHVGTQGLSDAFGWNKGQQAQQHDINESMVVILETLERALHKTEFQGLIRESFKIVMRKCIKCMNCQHVREKEAEEFFQLLVYTKGKQTLDEGILSLTIPEDVEGILCEVENSKQNAQMGYIITSTPSVLIVTLGRFDFDYAKLERVKITDPMGFDLELNLGQYTDSHQDKVYELYGILIHRGTAHSGHYFAYIRDILREGDWTGNIQQKLAKESVEKSKQEKQDQTQTPKQTKKKSEAPQNFTLKQPTNQEILQNWYQLNDTIVTPIQPSKIAGQFGGSECAYILFYRVVSAHVIQKPSPPHYLRKPIDQTNAQLATKRQAYNTERQHLVLNINGTPYRTNVSTTIRELLDNHCPKGHSLLNTEQKNQLPYYPVQISEKNQNLTDTILKADLVHQSNWKTVGWETEEYRNVLDLVGLQKVPIHANVLFRNKMTPVNTHTNRTLLDLRLSLQDIFKVPYQKQVIKLINNINMEVFLTDDPLNDEMTLDKLKFEDNSQLVLTQLTEKTQGKQGAQTNQAELLEPKQEGLLTFAVQRDDANGMRRYYLSNTMTLAEAFSYIKKSEGVDDDYKRRLRWTNRNRLLSIDQYDKLLSEFPFQQSLIKMKIQKGEIPIRGDICVKVRMQSKHQGQATPDSLQLILDPNQTQKQLKQEVCKRFGLSPQEHKLYRTDWLGDPVRPILKQQRTLFEQSYGMEEQVVLRDLNSKISGELLHLNISLTKTGFPEDCDRGFSFKTQETKTLKEVKEDLMDVPLVKEALGQNASYKRLRLRELKRDYMFGTILRNHTKTLKALNLQQTNMVLQVLDHDEQLPEDSIVLVVRVRDSSKRLYLDQRQFVFNCDKVASLVQLKRELLRWKQLQIPQEQVRIFKYYLRDLEWVEWTNYSFQKWTDLREKQNKARNDQKAKQKLEQIQHKNKDPKKSEKKKNNKEGKTNTTYKVPVQQGKEVPVGVVHKPKPEPSQRPLQDFKAQPTQPRNNQGDKKNAKEKLAYKKDEFQVQNLKKMPFLLKDGDLIAYGFTSEMLPGDDLQTQEDQNLKLLQQKQLGKTKGKARVKENPFALNLDF